MTDGICLAEGTRVRIVGRGPIETDPLRYLVGCEGTVTLVETICGHPGYSVILDDDRLAGAEEDEARFFTEDRVAVLDTDAGVCYS